MILQLYLIFCHHSLLNHIDLFLIWSHKVLIYLQSDLPSEKVLSALLTWELPSWDKQGRILIKADSSAGKESACNAGDPGSIPGLGGSAGKGIGYPLQYSWASLVAQLVKNLPAMRETWVQSLGWEDTLEKGKATLQYSGLENSMDCIVHGVAKSLTRVSTFHFPFPGYRHSLLFKTVLPRKGCLRWTNKVKPQKEQTEALDSLE